MKYIYVAPDCPRCHDLMEHYKELNIEYEKRDADRLKGINTGTFDDIDMDALAKLSFQQMVLPVEVEG